MEEMRLQKYIAMCGVASRRKAEELIDSGVVLVNGTRVTVQGYKVKPGDSISVNGKEIHPERNKIYILLNKPRGVVSTVSDEAGRKTVLDFIDGACPGNDYLGVEALDPVSVSLLQQRLNELGTGIKMELY